MKKPCLISDLLFALVFASGALQCQQLTVQTDSGKRVVLTRIDLEALPHVMVPRRTIRLVLRTLKGRRSRAFCKRQVSNTRPCNRSFARRGRPPTSKVVFPNCSARVSPETLDGVMFPCFQFKILTSRLRN